MAVSRPSPNFSSAKGSTSLEWFIFVRHLYIKGRIKASFPPPALTSRKRPHGKSMSDLLPSDAPAEFPPPQRPAAQGRPGWANATLRTIFALILREMATRYGRSPGGYLWAVLEPLGMILILAIGFSLLVRTPSLGTSFVLFYATGYLPFQLFQSGTRFVGASLKFSRPLLAYPAVSWIDAVLARFLLNLLTMLLVSYLILVGAAMIIGVRLTVDFGPLSLAYGFAAALGLGVGLVNCVLTGFVPVWDSIWSIVTRPLFIASGILFLFEELPPLAQSILWWNPLFHVTALARAGFFPMYRPEFVSLIFLALVALPLIFLGLVFMQRYHKDILSRT